MSSFTNTNTTTNTTTNNTNLSKYKLAICELFNEKIHGFDIETSDPDVLYHYLIVETINPELVTNPEEQSLYEDYESNFEELYDMIDRYSCRNRILVRAMRNKNINHEYIRNYNNIITNKKFSQPNIIEHITLRGDEYVAIIKTIWIKLIQRKWKKIYKERKEFINNMQKNNTLLNREINMKNNLGKNIPTIFGMLRDLNKKE